MRKKRTICRKGLACHVATRPPREFKTKAASSRRVHVPRRGGGPRGSAAPLAPRRRGGGGGASDVVVVVAGAVAEQASAGDVGDGVGAGAGGGRLGSAAGRDESSGLRRGGVVAAGRRVAAVFCLRAGR
jgi:hypothetical protein